MQNSKELKELYEKRNYIINKYDIYETASINRYSFNKDEERSINMDEQNHILNLISLIDEQIKLEFKKL